MRLFYIFLIQFTARLFLQSQSALPARNLYLQENTQQAVEFWNILRPSVSFHSSFRPYLCNSIAPGADSIVPFRHTALTGASRYSLKNQFLQVLPLVDLEAGYDLLKAKSLISASGGAYLNFNYGNFSAVAALISGSKTLPYFNDTLLRQKMVLPESGMAYGRSSYQFSDLTGYLSWTTKNKVFNFQAGRDKHFIGEGYRSLLLSDFAPPIPYAGINARVWRLQYNVWYNLMYDIEQAGGRKASFRNKYGTFHYLSYNATKNLNIGIFENVIWRGSDTSQARGFDVNYLNPVIFYRPVEYALHSPDNSFLGLNLSATLLRSVKFYGQLGLDEFLLREIRARNGWWANKQAWQLGAKWVNAFGIKGLRLQAEYNEVRPYTYSHGLVDQNYGHYGLPLAHPLGANFRELQFVALLRKDKWSVQNQTMVARIGYDSSAVSASMGQNIFRSYLERPYEYGHYTGQGIQTSLVQNHLRFSWYLNHDLNLRLEAGYIQRLQKNTLGYLLMDPYIYLGIRSTIANLYRDM